MDDPRAMLLKAAHELNIYIDWLSSKLSVRLGQVRDHYYYPRISTMCFIAPRGPATMPLKAPFEYYRLQEGGVAPDRRYFVSAGGSSQPALLFGGGWTVGAGLQEQCLQQSQTISTLILPD